MRRVGFSRRSHAETYNSGIKEPRTTFGALRHPFWIFVPSWHRWRRARVGRCIKVNEVGQMPSMAPGGGGWRQKEPDAAKLRRKE